MMEDIMKKTEGFSKEEMQNFIDQYIGTLETMRNTIDGYVVDHLLEFDDEKMKRYAKVTVLLTIFQTNITQVFENIDDIALVSQEVFK